jgi:hypothetical protein
MGCAGPLQQWGEETSLVSRAPGFQNSALYTERTAVLNAVVGFGLEGYSHQVSRSLSEALRQSRQPLNIMPAQEALSRINAAGFAEEYATMVTEYLRSGILNHKVLTAIGKSLETRYVFQPEMASFTQTMSSRFSLFGLRLFQTRISMLRLSVQLWDAQTGAIVWEASGEATLAGEDVREFRIPFEAIAGQLWRRILKEFIDPSASSQGLGGRAYGSMAVSAKMSVLMLPGSKMG